MQVYKLIGLLAGLAVTALCALLVAPSMLFLVVCDEWRRTKKRKRGKRNILEGF